MQLNPSLAALVEANQVQLGLLADWLEQVEAPEYGRSLDMLSGASMGKHVRHILDCFHCLLEPGHAGALNYDQRQRAPLLEEHLPSARAAILRIRTMLADLREDRPMQLGSEVLAGGASISTSLSRELYHAHEHTIHHLAILRVVACSLSLPVSLPREFGFAPATLSFVDRSETGNALPNQPLSA